MKILSLSMLLVLMSIASVRGQWFQPQTNPLPQVMLGWTAVPGAVSYKVYWGSQSRFAGGWTGYTNSANVGNGTNTSLVLTVRGQPYFFAATTLIMDTNSSGTPMLLESPTFSNEVSWTADVPPVPPGLTNPKALVVQSRPMDASGWVYAGAVWVDALGTNGEFRLSLMAPLTTVINQPFIASISPQMKAIAALHRVLPKAPIY